jgi:hypothetical protein
VEKISQETLAEMIGTTRARVSFFMNKFRKLGYIDYNGHLKVHNSLLNVVLYDKPDSNPRDTPRRRGGAARERCSGARQALSVETIAGFGRPKETSGQKSTVTQILVAFVRRIICWGPTPRAF